MTSHELAAITNFICASFSEITGPLPRQSRCDTDEWPKLHGLLRVEMVLPCYMISFFIFSPEQSKHSVGDHPNERRQDYHD